MSKREPLATHRPTRTSPVLASLAALVALTVVLGGLATAPAAWAAGKVGGCTVFPSDNIWNVPVDDLPVHAMSAAWIATIGATVELHPDFGRDIDGDDGNGLQTFGIPFDVVPNGQAKMQVVFDDEADDESDGYDQCTPAIPGVACYVVKPDATIEGGPGAPVDSDRHVLTVQQTACRLWELYSADPLPSYPATTWSAYSGAIFDLASNALRMDTWTSADAAGLPIQPGLVRVEEADQGWINHAFRFTTLPTQDAYVWPARHEASSNTNPNVPPMGIRVRLKKDFAIASYPPRIQTILRAMKKYGMMLADNGSDWYISGAPSTSWDDEELIDAFDTVQGQDFEVVDVSSLMVDPDSGRTPRMFLDGFEFGTAEGWDIRVGGF